MSVSIYSLSLASLSRQLRKLCVADGTPWAQNQGQDFIADHSSPNIDFATFHSWSEPLAVLLHASPSP